MEGRAFKGSVLQKICSCQTRPREGCRTGLPKVVEEQIYWGPGGKDGGGEGKMVGGGGGINS